MVRKRLAPLPRKNRREVNIMREAGRIVARVHAGLQEAIAPGVSTWELDMLAAEIMAQQGAESCFLGYMGFPAHTCVSINEELVHGIPAKSCVLKSGDIVSVDVGVRYRRYIGDSAWTYAVGEVSDQASHLMEVTKDSLYAGISAAHPGNRLRDVSKAVQQYVEGNNLHVVRKYTGHGVGKEMHEPPQVLNYEVDWPEAQQKMPEGLVFALEPMVQVGTWKTRTLGDNWTVVSEDRSLAAHFEHTVAVLSDGPCILTVL